MTRALRMVPVPLLVSVLQPASVLTRKDREDPCRNCCSEVTLQH